MSRLESQLILLCLFAALLGFGGAGAELVTRNYTAYKNRDNVINFKAILPKEITFGMVVSILEPYPQKGSLLGLRSNGNKTNVREMGPRPSVTTHTFLYHPNPQPKYPETDTLLYSVAGGNPDAETVENGRLNIVIINQPPRATPLTYRTIGTQPRTVTLRFRDFDEPIYRTQQQYVNGESTEVTLVEIVKIVSGNCTLAQNNSKGEWTTITGEHVKLSAPYQLLYSPSPNFTLGASCQFSYRVQDTDGAWSNEAIVTLQSKAPEKPRAYGATQTALIGVDGYVLLTLQSSSGNGRSGRTFFVRSLPPVGTVYVQEAEGKINSSRPLKMVPGGGPLQISKTNRRDTRMVLAYQPPAPTDAAGNWNGTEWVTLDWFVKDAGGISDDAHITIHLLGKQLQKGLWCGVTVLDPVFANKPYRRITLNYTIPEGSRIQRVAFVSLPQKPLGDFYVSESRDSDANAKRLGIGNMFNDARQHLFFQVRDPSVPFPDRFVQNYTFRVKNYNRQSCLGKVEVHFRTHDAPVATDAAGKPQVGNVAVRTEVCKIQHFTLLSLRGMANLTVAGGPKNVAAVRIVEMPTQGQLFSVVNTLPFKQGQYAVFCDQANCTEYINQTLSADSIVPIRTYDPESGLASGDRIYVLYRAPNVLPTSERDSFTYKFISKTGEESTAIQRVNMRLRDASADTLTFWYDKKSEMRILLQLSNRTIQEERVEILSKKHGHGHSRRIRLYQLKDFDGNRSVLGDEILDAGKTNEGDLSNGMFVTDDHNRIVVIPEVTTHRRMFTMHIKRYPVNPDGTLDFDSALTYRVRVKRRNHAPHWAPADCSNRLNCADISQNTMNASDATMPFIFAVDDEDNDSITFVLKTAPKFGTITYERMGLSGNTLRTATKGTRIQMKKATNGLQDTVILYYNHKPPAVLSRGMKYPVTDEFEIFGDDGMDRTSIKKMKLQVNAKADLKGTVDYIDHFKSNSRVWLSSSLAVAISVGVSIMMVVVVVTVVVRRRETRRRYMQLPVVVNQAQAGSGGSEMAPRKSNPELISLARGSNGDS